MLARLQTLLTPPVFPEDEEKTRVARLLNIILITVTLLVMLFSVPAFLMTPELGRIAIELILAIWSIFMLILLRRGRVRLAGFLLSFTVWAVVSYGTYEASGFRGSTLSAYFGIILIAELLLGVKAGITFGALSIAFAGLMVYADSQGLMPPPPAFAVQTTLLWEFSAVVIGVVGFLSLVMTSLHRALARARENEQKLAEQIEETRLIAQHATEANAFKTRLIARVSHELRTPLGAILGMSEMLQQEVYGPLAPSQQDVTARIIHNANLLEQVFAELLDQSQIESGQLKLKHEPFASRELIESVYTTYLPQAQQKGLQLHTEIDPDLPATFIGDENRIKQIISNLVHNAIKFTKTGQVIIRACRSSPGRWRLQVQDTGIGIPSDAQAFIFEPFRQVDETKGRQYGGVGLGLAIVHQLVTVMGGTVQLESREGHGSTFTVTLPVACSNREGGFYG